MTDEAIVVHWAHCRTAIAVLAAVLALTSAGAEQCFVRLVLDTSFAEPRGATCPRTWFHDPGARDVRP